MPIVIERLRAAGLAPVFVVDELDKVEHTANAGSLEDGMRELLFNLKHLVADYGFFCFLTDRDYFDHLRRRTADAAYPIEHTLFSHRLFVVHRAEHLHDYLYRVITVSNPTDLESCGKRILAYSLLHKAALHPFDLQRELAQCCDRSGLVRATPDELISLPRHLLHVALQVAVEKALAEPDLKNRIEQDPPFAQAAEDALYYLSRALIRGEAEVEIDRDKLVAYLSSRTEQSEPGHAEQLTDEELDVLYTHVQRLREGLCDVRKLVEGDIAASDTSLAALIGSTSPAEVAQRDRLSAELMLLRALRDAIEPDLLIAGADAKKLAWRYDAFGRSRMPAAQVVRETAELAAEAEPIADPLAQRAKIVASLRDACKSLGTSVELLQRIGVLPDGPRWEQVALAMPRIEAFCQTRQVYPELDQDKGLVERFAALILRRSSVIAQTLLLGVRIVHDTSPGETRADEALLALARFADLRSWADPQSSIDELSIAELPAVPVPHPIKEPADFAEWRAQLDEGARPVPVEGPRLEKLHGSEIVRLWSEWRPRLSGWLSAKKNIADASYDDVVLAAVDRLPSACLARDLSTVTVWEWSCIALDQVAPETELPSPDAGRWPLMAALYVLGFGPWLSLLKPLFGEISEDHDFVWQRAERPRHGTLPGRLLIASQGIPDSITSVPPNALDRPTLVIWHERLETAQPLVKALIDAKAIVDVAFAGPRELVKIPTYLARIVKEQKPRDGARDRGPEAS